MEGDLPVYYSRYGNSADAIFIEATRLRNHFGAEYKNIPIGAIGLYTYFQRLVQGLKQLMCGARKFDLQYISRDDLVALTPEAAEMSGITYIMDADKEEVDKILE